MPGDREGDRKIAPGKSDRSLVRRLTEAGSNSNFYCRQRPGTNFVAMRSKRKLDLFKSTRPPTSRQQSHSRRSSAALGVSFLCVAAKTHGRALCAARSSQG
eukprot:3740146-Rhodomonas_salina.1